MTKEEISKAQEWCAEQWERDTPNSFIGYGTLAAYAAHVTAGKDAEIERLRGRLSNLVEAVDALIAESEGVYGLHRNGDPAPWEELTEGGQFGGWLLALEEARAALEEEKADG